MHHNTRHHTSIISFCIKVFWYYFCIKVFCIKVFCVLFSKCCATLNLLFIFVFICRVHPSYLSIECNVVMRCHLIVLRVEQMRYQYRCDVNCVAIAFAFAMSFDDAISLGCCCECIMMMRYHICMRCQLFMRLLLLLRVHYVCMT